MAPAVPEMRSSHKDDAGRAWPGLARGPLPKSAGSGTSNFERLCTTKRVPRGLKLGLRLFLWPLCFLRPPLCALTFLFQCACLYRLSLGEVRPHPVCVWVRGDCAA